MGMRRSVAVIASVLLAACATAPMGQKSLLEFLHDGATTRTDVYLKLGPPGRTFEKDRIASWRLNRDDAGYFVVSSASGWRGTRYELVVVFGADDVAQRHSLVEIQGQ